MASACSKSCRLALRRTGLRSCCSVWISTAWGASTTVASSTPLSDSATHFSPRCSVSPLAVYCTILPDGLKRSPTTSICMAILPGDVSAQADPDNCDGLVHPLQGKLYCDTEGYEAQLTVVATRTKD